MSSPNAESASRRADSTASSRAAWSRTTRIPLPPPPADALINTGKPTRAAAARVSSGSEPVRSIDSRVGTPASATSRLDSSFEPITRMEWGLGPTHTNPASSTAAANSAFSAKNPYPGWTASAPVRRAASKMASMRR